MWNITRCNVKKGPLANVALMRRSWSSRINHSINKVYTLSWRFIKKVEMYLKQKEIVTESARFCECWCMVAQQWHNLQ